MGIHVYNKEKGFIPKSCGFQLICWCITFVLCFAIGLIVCVTNIDLGMILGRIVQLVILGPIVLFILFAIIGFIYSKFHHSDYEGIYYKDKRYWLNWTHYSTKMYRKANDEDRKKIFRGEKYAGGYLLIKGKLYEPKYLELDPCDCAYKICIGPKVTSRVYQIQGTAFYLIFSEEIDFCEGVHGIVDRNHFYKMPQDNN